MAMHLRKLQSAKVRRLRSIVPVLGVSVICQISSNWYRTACAATQFANKRLPRTGASRWRIFPYSHIFSELLFVQALSFAAGVLGVFFVFMGSRCLACIIRSLHHSANRMPYFVRSEQHARDALSLSTLTWPAGRCACVVNILAGIVTGFKCAIQMVVFASIVCNSTENSSIKALFATVINGNMMACTLMLSCNAVLSGMNSIVTPQDVPALVLGQLSGLIAATVQDKSKAGHTLLAAGSISTLLSGVTLLILGRLNAGDTLRKLPSPVVGGFVAAMGATAIRSALSALSCVQFRFLWPTDVIAFGDYVRWIHMGLGFYALFSARYLSSLIKPHVKSDQLRSFVGPLCLCLPAILFYVTLWYRGRVAEDIAWMYRVGWMNQPIQSKPFYTLWSETLRFDRVEWATLADPNVATSMVVLSALTALAAMLNIVSTSPFVPCTSNFGTVGGKVDLNRELSVLGCIQTLAGATTSTLPGYQSVSLSASLFLDGGTHRLAEFVAAGFVLAIFLSGFPVASLVPNFLLGGLLLDIGVGFCRVSLVDNWKSMNDSSYWSMLVIMVVALARDLTSAVAIGLFIHILLMVRQASTVNPVSKPRRCNRSSHGQNIRINGRLEVVHLQGPIFFGVVPTLEDELDSLLQASPSVSHLVLDMAMVTQVDDTGARALANLLRKASSVGVSRVAVSGANAEVEAELVRQQVFANLQQASSDPKERIASGAERFETLDEVLDIFEGLLEGKVRQQTLAHDFSNMAPCNPFWL